MVFLGFTVYRIKFTIRGLVINSIPFSLNEMLIIISALDILLHRNLWPVHTQSITTI